jgi:phosphoglycerate dehydrogenase-like enzyme
LRILMSGDARQAVAVQVASVLAARPHEYVEPGDDADIAFVSRDVTGRSTKGRVLPDTQRFYDALLAAPSLRWVHIHSAGADRPVYVELRRRGVDVTTSSGANAGVVVQTAVAGLLALGRRLPRLMAAQRRREWAPLESTGLPRDLAGQTAVIVGWGPIGQGLATVLLALGLKVAVVRSSDAPVGDRPGDASGAVIDVASFENIGRLLPRADWLVLACPLTPRTTRLVDAAALRLLPPGAHVVNVSRGEVIDEAALVAALRDGLLAGAYLDVFEQEPLAATSPLWAMDNVIATPHTAGHSDGNAARVAAMFIDNLGRFAKGEPLRHHAT